MEKADAQRHSHVICVWGGGAHSTWTTWLHPSCRCPFLFVANLSLKRRRQTAVHCSQTFFPALKRVKYSSGPNVQHLFLSPSVSMSNIKTVTAVLLAVIQRCSGLMHKTETRLFSLFEERFFPHRSLSGSNSLKLSAVARACNISHVLFEAH